jgi:hypothetical protein
MDETAGAVMPAKNGRRVVSAFIATAFARGTTPRTSWWISNHTRLEILCTLTYQRVSVRRIGYWQRCRRGSGWNLKVA